MERGREGERGGERERERLRETDRQTHTHTHKHTKHTQTNTHVPVQVLQQVTQLKDAVAEETAKRAQAAAQASKLEEDVKMLTDRCAQLQTGSADEILEAQVDELNKKLTCPACCTRQKDTIILKCYHMFCETCVRNRVQTRQRKCPQCSLPFGIHDFHKAYLT